MKANFDACCDIALSEEGGYVNNPKDPGGPTNRGITLATAKRLGLDVNHDGTVDIVDIKSLSEADARTVYRSEYWNHVSGDKLPVGLDLLTFDFAIHSGPGRAIAYLQKCVGVKLTGVIDEMTLNNISRFPIAPLMRNYNAERLAYLRSLSTWSTFGNGWTNRLNAVLPDALAMVASPAIQNSVKKGNPIMDWFNGTFVNSIAGRVAAGAASLIVEHGWATSDQGTMIGGALAWLIILGWSGITSLTSHNAKKVAAAVKEDAPKSTLITLANKVK